LTLPGYTIGDPPDGVLKSKFGVPTHNKLERLEADYLGWSLLRPQGPVPPDAAARSADIPTRRMRMILTVSFRNSRDSRMTARSQACRDWRSERRDSKSEVYSSYGLRPVGRAPSALRHLFIMSCISISPFFSAASISSRSRVLFRANVIAYSSRSICRSTRSKAS
jgi:hypothetical protein